MTKRKLEQKSIGSGDEDDRMDEKVPADEDRYEAKKQKEANERSSGEMELLRQKTEEVTNKDSLDDSSVDEKKKDDFEAEQKNADQMKDDNRACSNV